MANSALAEKDIETFLPLRDVISQWKDRKKHVELPLFPGYLFVNIELNDRLSVLNTHGVVRILGNNGDPIPVPTEEMDSIRKILQTRVEFNPFPYFTEGKEVVIIRGPLEGVSGRILQVRGIYRLILSVDLIKRSVSVEVDIRDIELA
ncbi:UpxY family transcription antiterminator [Desulfobacterota bacterium AH_259_B03_O07]|nr:UpxY family transcription antiterminator [Desulfobacterota bacterium AH_259_B03_O07]